jgi:hypothetical protein
MHVEQMSRVNRIIKKNYNDEPVINAVNYRGRREQRVIYFGGVLEGLHALLAVECGFRVRHLCTEHEYHHIQSSSEGAIK